MAGAQTLGPLLWLFELHQQGTGWEVVQPGLTLISAGTRVRKRLVKKMLRPMHTINFLKPPHISIYPAIKDL